MLPPVLMPTWNDFGAGLANHIWQSTLCLIILGAMTLLFRRNSAVVRYRLWLIASVKFLLPFSLFVGLGGLLQWHPVRSVAPIEVPVVVRQISQPFGASPVSISDHPAATVTPVEAHSFHFIFASAWFIGAVAVLLMWSLRWLHIARVVRNAEPLEATGNSAKTRILTSPASMEPGVFGILRPVLLLPEGVARSLTAAQLEPIIAHEMFHVRGRDNLAAALHTIVEAIFWFHPLVWWLGNRLVDERESACDEAVLRMGFPPADYAEGILKVCKSYVAAPACVSGVSGSNLKKRIEVIMENRGTNDLTLGKKLVLLLAGAGMLVFPLSAGMTTASEGHSVQIFRTVRPTLYEKVDRARLAVTNQVPVISVVSAVTLPVIEQATSAGLPILLQTPATSTGQTVSGQPEWLDYVSFIITDQEKRAYQQLTNNQQRQGFITNFWLARDPTPGTPANEFNEEYDRRLAYANEHFSTQTGIPGARTDRARVYIMNGPPDEFTVGSTISGSYIGTGQGNNFTVTSSSAFPSEIWRYRHLDGTGSSVVYVFVDKQKNGEYTLEYDPGARSK
jgi:GWxTD domain-containing protein